MDKNDPKKFQVWTTSSDLNNTENLMQNESTTKLIQTRKDPSSRGETRCSIIRCTILCFTLNLNYANVVRFPRELERHGLAFLVPYLTMMFLIGAPIVLLEMSLGQFLGQGSAHSWKASPFFRGAAVVGRLGSLLACLWISMQTSLILLYIGQLIFTQVPFPQCPSTVFRNVVELGYEEKPMIGQMCLEKSYLRTVFDSPLSFGLLAVGVVVLWLIVMLITMNNRVTMRSVIFFGICAFGLLLFQTGWQLCNTINNEFHWPQVWPFNLKILQQSDTWFNALVQVILSTQIGVGSIPVVTGKVLHKGDVIRMTSMYMCFNLLISTISTAYFMTTFGQHNSSVIIAPFPDLTAITSIYDRAFIEPHNYLRGLIPGLSYLMIVLTSLISLSIAIYSMSYFFRQKPRNLMCVLPMLISILCLLFPDFFISKLLDFHWTGIFIISAIILELIGLTWVYGTSSISVDLEFSIGRPISKAMLFLWASIPIMLASVLIYFMTNEMSTTLNYIEQLLPIVLCVLMFIYFAIYETVKQIDYNTCNRIREATHPSKDYGPADPIVRHAWKNWKSVCNGGYRDFTLRRRGTKDWTNSIKKGQYSHSKNATPESRHSANRSSNYSESIFGDSAIEEDIGFDKFSTLPHQNDQNYLHSYQSIPIRVSTGQTSQMNLDDGGSSSTQNISFIRAQEQATFPNRNPLYFQRNTRSSSSSFDNNIPWDQYQYCSFNGQPINCAYLKKGDEFSTEL